MNLQIVLARVKEIIALSEIMKDIFPNYQLVISNENEYYLIMQEKELIGFLHLFDKTIFKKLFIFPQYRNKGIGKIILEEAHKYFLDKLDPNKIFFHVRKENIKAINFFSKYGFKVVGNTNYFLKFKKIIIEKD